MQRERRHGILMHGIDGIMAGHAAGAGIVMPPPLSQRTLQPADGFAALESTLQGLGISEGLGETRQCIDGINLVGEGADRTANTANQSTRCLVSEKAMIT